MLDYFEISLLLNAIFSFLTGLFVLYRNYKSKINILWFLVSFSIGTWAFGISKIVVSESYNEAWIWNWVLYSGAIFIPIFYYHFVIALVDQKSKWVALSLYFGYFLSILFFIFNFTPYFVVDVPPVFIFKHWVKPGILYFPYFTYFVSYLFLSIILLASTYIKASGFQRQQIKYMMIAGIFGLCGGVTVFFPQLMGVYPFGIYFIGLYLVGVAYAILKYRLMGIRLIMSKFYTYTLLAAFAFTLSHFVWYIDINYLGGAYAAGALSFAFMAALIYSVALFPLINYIQKSSDTLFFKGYNPRAIIKDLTIRLSSVIEIGELLKKLEAEFKKILATDEVGVIILKKQTEEGTPAPVEKKAEEKKTVKPVRVRKSAAKNGNGKNMYMISESCSINWANLKATDAMCLEAIFSKSVLVRSEIRARGRNNSKSKRLVEEMDKYKVEVIAPLVFGGKVTGLIVLGEKISQEGYTQEDIEFLEIISSQAAVAIENALLYKEIGDFNKTLQKQVEEQTADLRDKNEYLEKLLVMRSEFLDIASHQLRTPVSVIKGMSSMIIEGGLTPEKVNEFLKAILFKANKLAEIINDILRASEMDSEKILLKFTEVNINQLLTKLVEDKQIQIKDKQISLTLSLPEEPLPNLNADERYLEQAIGNLINNSIQYTPVNGKIQVEGKLNNGNVEIRVIDNGIGIPKDDLPKLFSKFSRAKNAIAMYTDGTGLGLFIVKRIIEGHKGGKICIEKTEEGKGTTFLISLAAGK